MLFTSDLFLQNTRCTLNFGSLISKIVIKCRPSSRSNPKFSPQYPRLLIVHLMIIFKISILRLKRPTRCKPHIIHTSPLPIIRLRNFPRQQKPRILCPERTNSEKNHHHNNCYANKISKNFAFHKNSNILRL